MSDILIANIGTRNLISSRQLELLTDEALLQEWNQERPTLRSLTQAIYHDQRWDLVELNILNTLIDQLKAKGKELSYIYLFTSDQATVDGGITGQDTLYAGQIIKHLLLEQEGWREEWEANPSSNEASVTDRITCQVIERNMARPKELIPLYLAELNCIRTQHPQAELLICDTGGTPQQKASLKLAAEFMADDNCEYWQVLESRKENGDIELGRGKGKVERLDRDEYKKVILAQQIRLLISEGHYQGASKLKEQDHDQVFVLLKAMAHRQAQHLHLDSLSHQSNQTEEYWLTEIRSIGSYGLPSKLYPSLSSFLQTPLQALGNNRNEWGTAMNDQHYFDLCETLSLADYYWSIGAYPQGILNYYGFLEQFTKALISTLTGHDVYHEQADDFHTKRKTMQGIVGKNSVPDYIKYLIRHNSNQKVTQILDSFKITHTSFLIKKAKQSAEYNRLQTVAEQQYFLGRSNIRGINTFRNMFAHEGIGFSREEILLFQPNFESIRKNWHLHFSLPQTNWYHAANQELTKFLKNTY